MPFLVNVDYDVSPMACALLTSSCSSTPFGHHPESPYSTTDSPPRFVRHQGVIRFRDCVLTSALVPQFMIRNSTTVGASGALVVCVESVYDNLLMSSGGGGHHGEDYGHILFAS